MEYICDNLLQIIIDYNHDNLINLVLVNKNFNKNVKKYLKFKHKVEYIQDIYCNYCKNLLKKYEFRIIPPEDIKNITRHNYNNYIEKNNLVCYNCISLFIHGTLIYRFNNNDLKFFKHIDKDFFIFVSKHTSKNQYQYQYVISKYYTHHLLEFLQDIF